MASVRPWVPRAISVMAGVTLLLLVVQYLLGLWTNLNGPSMFTNNTSFASLDWHYNIGYVVFVAAVILVVFAALAKDPRVIGPSVAAVVAIVLAGVFGVLFVGSTPNNAVDSFLMGFMFLVAFGSTMAVAWRSWMGRAPGSMSGPSSSASTPSN